MENYKNKIKGCCKSATLFFNAKFCIFCASRIIQWKHEGEFKKKQKAKNIKSCNKFSFAVRCCGGFAHFVHAQKSAGFNDAGVRNL